ncbi:MAG: VCBS repeat-containing protein, partial [Planctomycetota bacterium]|nr:VCBS repeat-containing protein [Planctomycetota bacterium]
LSPRSDTSLWRLELPWAGGKIGDLIAIGDLDGGGCPEVMLQMWLRGVPYWMQCLLRGEDGSMLWSRSASSPHEAPGPLHLHLAGDVNGDGTPDLWAIGKTDFVWHDLVAIQSGLDGSMIRSAQRSCGVSGSSECPDLDGDGVNDLVVLSPVDRATRQYVVEVVSSRTLEPLVEFHCEDALSVAAMRTPHGVRIVVSSGPGLQAFDLVSKEGVGER